MSYDRVKYFIAKNHCIEGSPDHWWVTTNLQGILKHWIELKGHQIIGELRRCKRVNQLKRFWLKGHQIIGELRRIWRNQRLFRYYWRVTRSLVSYDEWDVLWIVPVNWRVTRSLVSYDFFPFTRMVFFKCIEGSPDHWWVTTCSLSCCWFSHELKGHQIIGELRRSKLVYCVSCVYWRVTRSLVSYDF